MRDEVQDGGDAALHVVHGCSVGVEVLRARLIGVFGASGFGVGGVVRGCAVGVGWRVVSVVGVGGGGGGGGVGGGRGVAVFGVLVSSDAAATGGRATGLFVGGLGGGRWLRGVFVGGCAGEGLL